MGESKAFKVKVGVHHDSAFSPLLFIIVLKALSIVNSGKAYGIALCG